MLRRLNLSHETQMQGIPKHAPPPEVEAASNRREWAGGGRGGLSGGRC